MVMYRIYQPLAFAVFVIYFTRNVAPKPIPNVPPGCDRLCRTGVLHSYISCTDKCPTIKVCEAAMVDPSVADERYIGDRQTSQRCEFHCWKGNEYTEATCMEDCPRLWCVRYGNVSVPRKPTSGPSPTSPPSITSTESPTSPTSPTSPQQANVEPSNATQGKTISIISLSLICSVLPVLLTGVIIGKKCKRRTPQIRRVEAEYDPVDQATGDAGESKIQPTPWTVMLDLPDKTAVTEV